MKTYTVAFWVGNTHVTEVLLASNEEEAAATATGRHSSKQLKFQVMVKSELAVEYPPPLVRVPTVTRSK